MQSQTDGDGDEQTKDQILQTRGFNIKIAKNGHNHINLHIKVHQHFIPILDAKAFPLSTSATYSDI